MKYTMNLGAGNIMRPIHVQFEVHNFNTTSQSCVIDFNYHVCALKYFANKSRKASFLQVNQAIYVFLYLLNSLNKIKNDILYYLYLKRLL